MRQSNRWMNSLGLGGISIGSISLPNFQCSGRPGINTFLSSSGVVIRGARRGGGRRGSEVQEGENDEVCIPENRWNNHELH